MQRMLFITAALALLLAACAPAKPTVDPAQIQASAVAAASTMIAQTQAAIPTNTPPPPTPAVTDTPALSPTPFTLPTLANAATPTTGGSSGGGDCNQLFDVGASGPTTNLQIRNNTRGPITVSMGVNRKNTFGQCGYLSWANISKADSITVSLPLVHTNMGDACYWAYAWINDPKKPGTVSGGGYCIDNTLKWTLDVYYDKFRLTPP